MGLGYALEQVSDGPVLDDNQLPEPADDAETEEERTANLLRHAGTGLFGAPVWGAARPITVQAIPTPARRQVGSNDVVWLAATTARLGQLGDDLDGLPMLEALTAHARVVSTLPCPR